MRELDDVEKEAGTTRRRGIFVSCGSASALSCSWEVYDLFAIDPSITDPTKVTHLADRLIGPEDRRWLGLRRTRAVRPPRSSVDLCDLTAGDVTRTVEIYRSRNVASDGRPWLWGTVQEVSATPCWSPAAPPAAGTPERMAAAAIDAAIESERARLAEHMHDDILAALSALALRLSTTASGAREPPLQQAIAGSESELRSINERLRALVFDLALVEPEESLRSAIERYATTIFAGRGTTVSVSGDTAPLSDEAHHTAYRVAQEALRNACQHAGATHVEITLHNSASALRMEITDNGRGLAGAPPARPAHVGLKLIRNRVHNAGGRLDLFPGTGGHGLRVRMLLPLDVADAVR